MFAGKVSQNSFIFKQGDSASCFFVIAEGAFEVIIDGKPKKILKKGDSFGEYALLYNSPRSAGLKAVENCIVWGI